MLNTQHDVTADELVQGLPDAIVLIDAEANVRWGNAAAERLVGRPLAALVGTNGLALIHPDDLHLAALSLSTVQNKDTGSPIELRVATHAGWRLVELVGAPLSGGHIALAMRDLTQRRRWEVAGDEVARFRSLVQNAATLTMLVNGDGIVVSASAAVTRRLGQDQEQVCGRPLAAIVAADDQVLLTAAIEAACDLGASGHGPMTVEARLSHRDGTTVPFELTIVSLLDDPTVEGLVVSGHDISRLRAAQDALAELANFDALTGLPNRRTLETDLEREWMLAGRDEVDSYVVVTDLDGFKELNDRYGHAAGDEALRQFAHALRLSVRDSDVVARLGGDEFAVVLVRCGDEAAATSFEERLRGAMRGRPWPAAVEVGVSIGWASLRDASSPADALHRADTAMYRAKHAPAQRQSPVRRP